MGFVSSLLGIANKVGGIANKFVNHAGIVGKIASGVNKAANLVSSVIPKVSPVINAITTGAKIAYQSGLAVTEKLQDLSKVFRTCLHQRKEYNRTMQQ